MGGFATYASLKSSLRAGQSDTTAFLKLGPSAAGGLTASLWNQTGGSPGAGGFGTALTARTRDNTSPGAVPFVNHTGSRSKFLATFGVGLAGQPGDTGRLRPTLVYLVDRLLEAPFNGTVTSGTFNGGTPLAIPSRDINGAALGDGCMMFVENASATGAASGGVTVGITYTNQAGTAGQSVSLVGTAGTHARDEMIALTPSVTTSPGPMFVTLATGDTGVRKIEGYTLSGSIASTQLNIVICRVLCVVPIYGNGDFVERDTARQISFIPRLYDGTCLQVLLAGQPGFGTFPATCMGIVSCVEN